MQKSTVASGHRKRVEQVCEYIHHNLDHPLSLDELSQIACCSPFHFSRLFVAFTGMGVNKYQLLARLKRASYRLAFQPDVHILNIALEAGFDSHAGFTRAFKRVAQVSPSQFRQQPDWHHWHACFHFPPLTTGSESMNVSIVDFSATPVAYLTHTGHPQRVYDTAAKFIQWRKSSGLSPVNTSDTFGIAWHDPTGVPADEFRFDICGSHSGEVPDNPFGVSKGQIPDGRCAMAIHKGSHDNIGETVHALYQQWLPEANEELRDYPCFFHYLNLIHQVDECDLLTKVYLPLK